MAKSYRDRALALAAITQACQCVEQIANTGMSDADAMTTCINSIFIIDADRTEDIFNTGDHLHSGIRYCIDTFSSARKPDTMNVMQYSIGAVQLERSLAKHPELLQQISTGIERTRQQLEHFPVMHPNIMASLGGLYSETLSTIKPRIMVSGEQVYLTNPENTNRIRALLLAAVRAAVLWRQLGGSRLQLLLSRKRYLSELEKLI